MPQKPFQDPSSPSGIWQASLGSVFGCSVFGCSVFGCSVFGCSVSGCSVFGCSVFGCGGGPQGAGPGASAYLWITDPSIEEINATTKPARLLRNDGGVTTQIIRSVAVADPTNARRNMAFDTGTKVLSLRSFLSANAIRARNALDDIDYCSSNNSTVCAVQSITVPVTFVAMGAYYFIRDNERMFEMSASTDKEFVTIEGATHSFTPCGACETTKGQYSNTMKNLFDYAAAWMGKRFR